MKSASAGVERAWYQLSESFFADRKTMALTSAHQIAPWILARMNVRSYRA
jgi:hypothetical protein